VSGTGTGAAAPYTVYGQVPPQATPSPAANYTDTVTITVTF
jgi:spore coat protein U-like protein